MRRKLRIFQLSLIVRDSSDDFIVSLDDPNEEITELRQDGLHDWYICRDDQCTVEPARILQILFVS